MLLTSIIYVVRKKKVLVNFYWMTFYNNKQIVITTHSSCFEEKTITEFFNIKGSNINV